MNWSWQVNREGEERQDEGGLSGSVVIVLQNMIYGVLCHYPGRNSGFAPNSHNVVFNVSWFQITREVAPVCWTNMRRVANVMLSHTRTLRSLNRIRKSESRPAGRVNALSHVKSDHRTVFILSRHHNTEICGPSHSSKPSDIQISVVYMLSQSEASMGVNWPIRAEQGADHCSSGGNDHFMVLHSKRRCGKDILYPTGNSFVKQDLQYE